MKKSILHFLIIFSSLTACKTKTEAQKTDEYTESEKLEIAQLALLTENFTYNVSFSEGKATVMRNDSAGIVDLKGTVTMLPNLLTLQPFQQGLAAASTRANIACYVDLTGKIVHEFPNYESVDNFVEGDFSVFSHKNGNYGLIDKNFKEVIPAKYNQTRLWRGGIFIVETGGKWGAVDKDDKTVIPFEYESLDFLDDGGYIEAKKKTGKGFIDKTGKEVVPCTFYYLSPFNENLAFYSDKEMGEKYGVINRKGETVLPPQPYIRVEPFSNGMAVVAKEVGGFGLSGYIDAMGKEIIAPQYLDATSFSPAGAAVVGDGTHVFMIDKKGQKLAAPKLEDLTYEKMERFENGFVKLKLSNGEVVYIDRFGNPLSLSDIVEKRDAFFK